MRDVKAWAEAHGEDALLARCHRRISAHLGRIGDPALMLEHAVAAVELLDADTPDVIRTDHLLGLADALGNSGAYDDAIRRYEERRAGDLDAAQASLDRGRLLIEQYALTGQRTESLREQAELHAARDQYREAYETFRAFHIADGEMRALERDRRGRTLHAMFEATEARRSSDFFRELSAREVLRRVAGILEAAAAAVAGGLAVRMGGEEFLLLLPGVDRREGLERLDRLRCDVAGYAWADVTEGIAVTVSIGVAAAPADEIERGALLALADRNMYAAKRSGRDRVFA